jgi:hypothetical protein
VHRLYSVRTGRERLGLQDVFWREIRLIGEDEAFDPMKNRLGFVAELVELADSAAERPPKTRRRVDHLRRTADVAKIHCARNGVEIDAAGLDGRKRARSREWRENPHR